MAWSTRELADLAGTTLKAVRYYHEIGLLEEPERGANGYKRYRLRHLLRLVRIRRLADLGVPLSDIAAVQESAESAEQVLRALDAELAASIERQQRIRDELAGLLRHRTLLDLPPGFPEAAAALPESDRALLLAYSRVFGSPVMAAVRDLVTLPRAPVDDEFDALSEDADEPTRQALAERMAPEIQRQQRAHPVLADPVAQLNGPHTASVVVQALVERYSPAQLDVLRRATGLLAADGDRPRPD
ncbi:DNA-binding transcriptional MerR regulator [Crossiella equi]|uniref:DNA-binding transcriptional MerR regulator n=1 Tax=Crossiella equi TaxID=130796 RepID=A0ABS5AS83_9PSEU|nr:MerR family transcriptional regulator [Crossiella equi]MBP2479418.1 DNA-binding transcriptional MerR regulator [Crossiella equi]